MTKQKQLPELTVESVRKIYDDGNHNAFTDMQAFQGRIYLTFRSSPSGHDVSPDSTIVVLRSENGDKWEKIHEFNVAGRDARDPHFLIFKDSLFIYSGTWLCNGEVDLKDHVGFAVWTKDGELWNDPVELEGTYGYFIWRAAAYGKKAYLCTRLRKRACSLGEENSVAIQKTLLMESEDGLKWKKTSCFEEKSGNETAFIFEDDGALVAIVRDNGGNSLLCKAKPPYQDWSRENLNRFIGGPMLAKWGTRYLVGGRKKLSPENHKTVLSWLVDGRLEDIAELPSGGDNSYPGFIALNDERGLLSYYSSHEGSGDKTAPCSIYLAELTTHPVDA